MTALYTALDLGPWVTGDGFPQKFDVIVEATVTVSKAWLTVKGAKADADAAALVHNVITTTAGGDGQITGPVAYSGSDPDVPTGSQVYTLLFNVQALQTASLVDETKKYPYDVQALLNGTTPRTAYLGSVTATGDVTKATS